MRLFKPAPPKVESGAMKNSRSDSSLHISLLTRLIAWGHVALHLKTYSTVSKTGALAATSWCSVRRPSTSAALRMLLSARVIRVCVPGAPGAIEHLNVSARTESTRRVMHGTTAYGSRSWDSQSGACHCGMAVW